jgi:hypothetical protein
VGTSAGLNLGLNRYRYRWDELEWGPESTVLLESELRGADLSLRDIEVLSRAGLDLNPVDVRDPDERLWPEALIWPEHHQRRARLTAALDLIRNLPVGLVAGDALETLGPILEGIPGNDPVVMMSSFIGLQLTVDQHQQLSDVVSGQRTQREMLHVSMEARVRGDNSARVIVDDGSGGRVE